MHFVPLNYTSFGTLIFKLIFFSKLFPKLAFCGNFSPPSLLVMPKVMLKVIEGAVLLSMTEGENYHKILAEGPKCTKKRLGTKVQNAFHTKY